MPSHIKQERYDPEYLRSLFDIGISEDGSWRLYHAIDRTRKDGFVLARRGDLADTTISHGYRRASLLRENGKVISVMAHRAIWAIHHRKNPRDSIVDHADRNTLNNDPILNLSLVDDFGSIINRSQTASGPIGVWRREHKTMIRYRACVTHPETKKPVNLGAYDTLLEAQLVVDKFIVSHRGVMAPTNTSLGRLVAGDI